MSTKKLVAAAVGVLALGVAACDTAGTGPITASPLPSVEGGGAGSSARSAEALLGQWRLIILKPRATTPRDVAEPEKYTIAFDAEGRVAVRSDCNRCGGGYTADGASLGFTPMACTKAYCGDDSLDDKYERLLSAVDRWAIADSRLTLSSAEGALVFVR